MHLLSHKSNLDANELYYGQNVLLFNSHLCLFRGKLCSQWSRPFVVKEVFPHGSMENESLDGSNGFKVNG